MRLLPPGVSRPAVSRGRLIFGQFEQVGAALIRGWAIDRLDPRTPLKLRIGIDGRLHALVACDTERPDLAHLNLPSRAIGFEFRIPVRFRDGARHVLTLATLEGDAVHLPDGAGRLFGEIHFALDTRPAIDGMLDGLVDGMIQGWALKTDPETGEKTGGLRVLISAGGQPVAELAADQFRADVAEAGDADPCCGFAYALPPEVCAGKTIWVEAHVMPGRVRLRHSPVEIALPSGAERGRILALLDRADELFRFARELRKELQAVLPADRYSLADYERWALQNRPRIAGRAASRYGEITGRPLVSVLCPVYRPNLADFCAAIDSVRAQSYGNWELILVDDGSLDAALTGIIEGFAAAEPRIRWSANARNAGIAAASNHALREARGELCVFFDHDDLLDPNALEVLLRARSATGARLLYADEDKVNAAGRFSEPNFKPDFNYRFLLELNYICHPVMAETALARELQFDPRLDGAQDHDFLLRCTERLAPHSIHHVPEILYHWRISPDSAAAPGGAGRAAARAGVQAVRGHLRRRGRKAEIASRGGFTCYRVTFPVRKPQISIIIPFRDHIKMTGQCVDAIRAETQGVEYEILLLDNWSSGAEAESFAAAQANLPGTRVIRIAEPFNFSRINNLGAAAARFPLLLFLNNDVRVRGPDWLRILAGEMLADPEVAAVGAKLVYPQGGVQHAGVVLGIGGVGDHACRGLPEDAPGYVAHAIATREVSAVTAACMLVRAASFHEVGGFDEKELGIAFNDIDLCIRLRNAGHRIVFAPECVALHHESISRGDDLQQEKLGRFMRENQVMLERWRHLLPHDPFYNPHFARDGGIFRDLRVLRAEDLPPLSSRPADPAA